MIEINCTTCKATKPAEDFYAHPRGPHGRMRKCKECHKAYVRRWYSETRPARSAYEAERSARPERKKDALRFQRVRRAKSPEKYKARSAVGNAIRDGQLKRGSCEGCGSLHVHPTDRLLGTSRVVSIRRIGL
jgi:hypothetical protein